jgi:branched-chain amino acid transport system permease protein
VDSQFTLGRDILPPLLVTFGCQFDPNGLLEVFSADSFAARGGISSELSGDGAPCVGTLPLLFCYGAGLTTALQLLFARTTLGRAFRRRTNNRPNSWHQQPPHALATAVALRPIAVPVCSGAATIAPPMVPPAVWLRSCHHRRTGLYLGNVRRRDLGASHRLSNGSGLGGTGHVAFLAVLLFKPLDCSERN